VSQLRCSVYTRKLFGKLGGGLFYWRTLFKKQRSGRRVVSYFIKPFEARTGNTIVWCHSHMAFWEEL
jgi:hypothetical protein